MEIIVKLVDHSFGIREAALVELMASPLVLFPVKPVEDDIVEGDPAFAELLDHRQNLLLRGVALPALPQSQTPFGHEGRPAGEDAVAADHLIEVLAMDEIIVDLIAHLRPEGEGIGRCFPVRGQIFQPDVPAHMDPLNADLMATALLHGQPRQGRPGQPVLPVVIGHQLAVQPHSGIAGGVESELELPALRGLDPAAVAHTGDIFLKAVGKGIVDIDELMFDARFHTRSVKILKIGVPEIFGGEPPRRAVLVIELQVRKREIVAAVTEAGLGVVVPKQAVVSARDQEGVDVDDVELEEIDIMALVVHDIVLMLAEPVKGLIRRRMEKLLEVPGLLLHHRGGGEHAAAVRTLGEDEPACGCVEGNRSAPPGHPDLEFGGGDLNIAAALFHAPDRGRSGEGHSHQARARRKGVRRGGDNADEFISADLDLEQRDSVCRAFVEPEQDALLEFFEPGESRGQSQHDPGQEQQRRP